MERIKAIVDYALDGNLTEMRDTLHAEMLDRVQLTLEGLKKYVAQSLILPESKEEDDEDEDDKDEKKEKKSKKDDDDDDHDDEKEDKKLVKKMVKKDALKNEEVESLDETPETKPKRVVQGPAPAGTFAADKAAGKFKALKKKFGDPNKKPKKVVGEEVEQIDEISKDLAGRYAEKAAVSNFKTRYNMAQKQDNWDKSKLAKHFTKRPELTDKEKDKIEKRSKGVDSALNRIQGVPKSSRISLKDVMPNNEEVEQIDEKNWIKGAIKHKGALHKELGVPEGKKIPEKELEKAAHAKGKEGRRARLAMTLKDMR